MILDILHKVSTLGLTLIESAGYIGVFTISLLENVFTPIPSEAVIPFAGVLVTQGRFELIIVVFSASLGSLVGAYIFYGLGYVLGSERIRVWIVKWGRYVFITESDLDRAETWFARYDRWAVLICRIVPLVRSFISIPAGYVRMPLVEFSVLTFIGTAIWSTLLVYLGVIFGNNYTHLLPIFRKLDLVFAVVFLIIAAYYAYQQYHRRKQSNIGSN